MRPRIQYINILQFLILACACSHPQGPQPVEPPFTNKITIKQETIALPANDADSIRHSNIVRLFYFNNGKDSGYVYRTMDLGCYMVRNQLFMDHKNRETIRSLPTVSDIFEYGQQIFAYNTKTNAISPFLLTPGIADSNMLFSLSKESAFKPKTPLDSRLLIKDGGALRFVYNYSLNKASQPNNVAKAPFLIVTDSNEVRQFGHYPAVFFKEELRDSHANFVIDTFNHIYYVFPWLDTVYKINTKGQELGKALLHQYPKRDVYKMPKPGDLAYIRKYEAMNEKNIDIFICRNKYVVVIKQMAAERVTDKQQYKVFVYNTNLEKLYTGEVGEAVYGGIPNNKGFLLISKDYKKIISYELP